MGPQLDCGNPSDADKAKGICSGGNLQISEVPFAIRWFSGEKPEPEAGSLLKIDFFARIHREWMWHASSQRHSFRPKPSKAVFG